MIIIDVIEYDLDAIAVHKFPALLYYRKDAPIAISVPCIPFLMMLRPDNYEWIHS